ncbi:MAG: diguanylate cyclase [Edaphobacter sp.]|nr:diguanylate cyclase [Edaphobacter sp.]
MDYGTLYLFDGVSLAIYAVAMSLLAIKNRNIKGMRLFAGAVLIDVGKTVLQGLRGQVPAYVSGMLANELNILSFLAMYLGFHWFVVRTPLRNKMGGLLLAGTMVLYAVLFLLHGPYTFALAIAPVLVLCGLSVWLLLKQVDKSFRTVSQVAAAVLSVHIAVVLYRAMLVLPNYGTPATSALGNNDPRLLYSMLAIMLLNGCLVMTYAWFCVTMIQGRLARFAQTDALTGVLNRRALEIAADREMARCEQGKGSVVLFAIDLDHFKRVNDVFGHRGGDLALRELVHTMKRELRLMDLVARAGGDEFVVLLPDIGMEAALKIGERLRSAVAQSRTPFQGGIIQITISVGVTQFLPTDGTWHAALDRADRALYRCKDAGRNGVVLDYERTELFPASLDTQTLNP